MSDTGARRLAWGIAWTSIGLAVLGAGLGVIALLSGGEIPEMRLHQAFGPIFAIAYSLIGGIVAARRPRNPIGWISVVVGLFTAVTLAAVAYGMLSESTAGPLAGTDLALWVEEWAWFPPSILPMTILLLLFPNGRPPSRMWRPIGWAAAAGLVEATLAMAVVAARNPGVSLRMDSVETALSKGELDLLIFTAGPLLVIGLMGSIAAPIVRFRRSSGIERQQLKWMAYAGGIAILGVVVGSSASILMPGNALAEQLGIVLSSAVQVGIVLAAGIAILRYRLYDIDLVVNRTLVYGTLTVLVVGLYVIVVGSLGAVFQSRGSLSVSLFGAGLVAVLFQPLRERLESGVNRLMYGERDDPYLVLSRLGQRLEATLAPQAVLPTIVETLGQTLRLPYVAIELKEGEGFRNAAEFGRRTGDLKVLPLTYQAETIGRLLCGPRGRGEPFNESEIRLLGDVAHQAGVAVHAVSLTADLQRSRERLVSAREEERRRLRRDLHDGLGPHLASMALKIDAVRNHLLSNPDSAEAGLVQLKEEMNAAIAGIRRLVYELRPPALDELGLVSAIREHVTVAGDLGRDASGNGLKVSVEAPDPLPPLPAAVEVAAYRIALEAFTNVVRHARAAECVVRFTVTDALEVEVTDDGVGLPPDVRVGVGLASMRERAEELGGGYAVEPKPGGGTRVHATLPLPASEDDG